MIVNNERISYKSSKLGIELELRIAYIWYYGLTQRMYKITMAHLEVTWYKMVLWDNNCCFGRFYG